MFTLRAVSITLALLIVALIGLPTAVLSARRQRREADRNGETLEALSTQVAALATRTGMTRVDTTLANAFRLQGSRGAMRIVLRVHAVADARMLHLEVSGARFLPPGVRVHSSGARPLFGHVDDFVGAHVVTPDTPGALPPGWPEQLARWLPSEVQLRIDHHRFVADTSLRFTDDMVDFVNRTLDTLSALVQGSVYR